MTRARILADYVSSGDELADKAPLASPAFTGTPTGITAAHLTTAAALPAAVTGGSGLDAVSPANLASGVLPVGVTGGTGLTSHGRIGDSARSYLTASMTNRSGETFTSGFTNDWIDNSAIFAHHADGLKVLISGTYLATWGIYTFSASNSSPINETYFQEYLAYKNNGTPDTEIPKTYTIFIRPHDGHADRYRKPSNAHIIPLNANDVVAHRMSKNGGNNYTVSGGVNDTFITMTYLSEHT